MQTPVTRPGNSDDGPGRDPSNSSHLSNGLAGSKPFESHTPFYYHTAITNTMCCDQDAEIKTRSAGR